LVQGGHLNNYSFNYVNNQRASLKSLYPSFEVFKNTFTADQAFMDAFFAYVQKEDPELKFDEVGYKTSEHLIKLRLKSLIAQDLWGVNEMFQVYNESNEILQRAVEILKNKEYDKVKLD
jgi:carboxyl-terminal processing protease